MYDRTGNYLIVAIVLGLILGIAVPVLFGNGVLPVKFLGDIFLNALKLIAVPLVLCAIVMGITNLGALGKLGRIGLKTLAYFLATAALAVFIGMALANLLQPGIGAGKAGMPGPQVISYSFLDWLVAQFPPNVFAAISEFRLLPIVLFAFLFGSVLALIGPKGKPVVTIIESLTEALMKMLHLIMWFAPLGVFGLVAGQIAAAGGLDRFWSELGAIGGFAMVVLIGLSLQAIIILPLILKFFGGKSPVEFAGGMSSALLIGLASASSAATLPVTMECVESKNDIDKRASALVLPPAAAIYFNGTALFIGAAAVFILQAQGGDLSILSQVVIFITAVLASFAVAGIPQAGLLGLALVLQAYGMPMENIGLGLGLLLGVDWFLDRCRTVVNVWGSAVGAAVLASTEEIGLVDRRPRPLDKQQRFPRFKVPLRRQEFGGRKKGFEAPGRGGGDRGPATGKRPDTIAVPIGRRSGGPDRGREERRGQRPQRPEHREREYRGPERREEYRPNAGPTPEQGLEKRAERPERPEHPERRERSDRQQRQPFSRRGHRGDRPGRGGQRDAERELSFTPSKEPLKEVAEGTVAELKSDFEVPKFPEKILEELAAPAAAGVADEFAGEGPDQPESEHTPEPDVDDFARLDRMVMGEDETPEPASRATEDRWEPAPEPPAPESVFESYVSESPTDDAAGGRKDEASPADELPHPAESSLPAESAKDEEELAPGETAAAESGDDLGPIQWGRPKRKKLSR